MGRALSLACAAAFASLAAYAPAIDGRLDTTIGHADVLTIARAAAAQTNRPAARQHHPLLLATSGGAAAGLPPAQAAQLGQPRPLPDTTPRFRWLGLLTSPGGLLIVALAVAAIVLTWLVAHVSQTPGEPPDRRTRKTR